MILISLCLCRINKHAEQLSILRGIDRRDLTSVEKHLVALFGGRDGRDRGKAGETAHPFLNYNKPPTSVNKPHCIMRNAAFWETFPESIDHGSNEKADWSFVNWDGGYFDRSTCTCLHGSSVPVWADGWRYSPSLVPPAGWKQLTDSTSEQL